MDYMLGLKANLKAKTDITWLGLVILICTTLMVNDVEHLFLCLSATYISFLVKYLFIFCPLSKWIVFLVLSLENFLSTMDSSLLSDDSNIFSLLIGPFTEHKF